MKPPSSLGLVFRHAAIASAVILVLACVAERLAPGSVLSYISLWQLVGGVVGIQIAALCVPRMTSRAGREVERVLLFGVGLVAVLFLFLIVRDGGNRSMLLVFLAAAILLLGTIAFPNGE